MKDSGVVPGRGLDVGAGAPRQPERSLARPGSTLFTEKQDDDDEA